MSRIEEIKARAEAATPGPWPDDYVYESVRHIVRNCDMESDTDPDFSWNRYMDAPFIAHAREDIPYLLDELADSFPKTWSGLMAFVDHYYPRDIFTESDDQPGSRIVWLLRQLATTNQERDEALARVERAKAVLRERVCACVMYGGIAKCVRCEALAILEGDTE